ncbi:class I SAM-dependent methyltransferase [Marivirga tractuosa]|uniref:class I SAM-dependent methyltransferase n=1 Tax=Marivirga tractuosa TaxID=1006 RepID=UPI0035CEA75E
MDNQDMKVIASQLRQPHGKKGIEVAELMNETNIKMTCHSIDQLNILDNDKILELGHGNCGHLKYLLNRSDNLKYYGLETSELMMREAQNINSSFVDNKKASFHFYEGLNIPFSDHYFDRIFTVNTIYFWDNPKFLMLELYRVIKPFGILNITFSKEKFMRELPFTQYGFDFYNGDKIAQLIGNLPFRIVASNTQTETVKSKAGDTVKREFTTISVKKEV